jgi:hypothetical protein
MAPSNTKTGGGKNQGKARTSGNKGGGNKKNASTYTTKQAPFAQPTTLTTLKVAMNTPWGEFAGSTGEATRKRVDLAGSTRRQVSKKIPRLTLTEEEQDDEEEDEEEDEDMVPEGMVIRTISTLSKTSSDKDPAIAKFRENVRNNLFHGVKFIEKAESLEYGGAISNRMFEKVRGVQEDAARRSYWSSYRGNTNKTLNEKRGNVNNEIRKAFFGKCRANVTYQQKENNNLTHCYILSTQSTSQKRLAPNRR